MMKMKYLIPDIDKHTAGIVYISLVAVLITVTIVQHLLN